MGAPRFPVDGSMLDHVDGTKEGNSRGERDEGAIVGTVCEGNAVFALVGNTEDFDHGRSDGLTDGTSDGMKM